MLIGVCYAAVLSDRCFAITAGRAAFYLTWPAFKFFPFLCKLALALQNWIITLTAFSSPPAFSFI